MKSGSLNLEWDMVNSPAGQSITVASLYVNETNIASLDNQNIISEWSFSEKKPVVNTRGKNLFPGRFFVSYKQNTYAVTLKNLQYNDTGSFLLRVAIRINQFTPSENDYAVITISQIKGEYGYFIFSVPV